MKRIPFFSSSSDTPRFPHSVFVDGGILLACLWRDDTHSARHFHVSFHYVCYDIVLYHYIYFFFLIPGVAI